MNDIAAAAGRQGNLDALAVRMNALCDATPFRCGWYVEDLRHGGAIDRAGHVPAPSQSTRKIAFMMAALRAVHQGRIDLSEPVTVDARLQEGVVSGVLYFMTPGLTFPLHDAIVQMIITSDNTCTSLVGERLGVDYINDFCASIGMKGTLVRELVPPRDMPADHDFDFVCDTTPADLCLLLKLILDGTTDPAAAARLGCTPQLCRFAMDVLVRQVYRTRIPLYLPAGTVVAHKTGSGIRGAMDAGIVFEDGRPLFSIAALICDVPAAMPDGLPGVTIACELIGRLSRAAWDHLAASGAGKKG